KALTLKSDSAEIHYNRALALLKSDAYAEAVEGFNRALAINPRYVAALNDRGNALFRLGEPGALESFDAAIRLQPDFAPAHNGRGATLTQLRHYDEAFAAIERALAIEPNYADALSNRGTAYLGIEKLDEALADFERALAPAPMRCCSSTGSPRRSAAANRRWPAHRGARARKPSSRWGCASPAWVVSTRRCRLT